MNWQHGLKTAKNGLQLISLIAPIILELEKCLKNFFVQPLSLKCCFINFSLAFYLILLCGADWKQPIGHV